MLTIQQAQAKCRKWRDQGDARSLEKARKLEASFKCHPDYESDQAWLLRMQSGEQAA